MRRTTLTLSRLFTLITLAAAVASSGCTSVMTTVTPGWTPGQTAGTSKSPRVENCAIVSISSPTKYACDEKIYTSFQLAQLRMDEKQKSESGR